VTLKARLAEDRDGVLLWMWPAWWRDNEPEKNPDEDADRQVRSRTRFNESNDSSALCFHCSAILIRKAGYQKETLTEGYKGVLRFATTCQ